MSTSPQSSLKERLHKASERVAENPVADKILHSDSLVFTFLRSIVSSQAASWLDMGLSFALFAWAGFSPWWATATGAFAGGVLNCIINYRFTFHAAGCPWKAVAVKYILVWIGSLLLNAYGTHALYLLLQHWTWLEELGFRPDGYFAAARLATSLIVSWAWNFLLQRYFVYRNNAFDPYAIRLVNLLTFQKGTGPAD